MQPPGARNIWPRRACKSPATVHGNHQSVNKSQMTIRGVNNIPRHTITARRTRGCAMGGRSPRAPGRGEICIYNVMRPPPEVSGPCLHRMPDSPRFDVRGLDSPDPRHIRSAPLPHPLVPRRHGAVPGRCNIRMTQPHHAANRRPKYAPCVHVRKDYSRGTRAPG